MRPGCLDHLGVLKDVSAFVNDEQIKEAHYRVELAGPPSYTIRIWLRDDAPDVRDGSS